MPALTAMTLRGVWGTVLLPLTVADRIDWDRLADELAYLSAAGLDGIYAHGTAGEFHTLDEAEYVRINELLAAACGAVGLPFQIGATHPHAQETLRRVQLAAELEPGALQVLLPDWLPLTDEEVESYVVRVASLADPVPLVLYNPPHAKTQVTPALLGRLLDRVPTLIGVKVPGGDDAWYSAMAAHTHRCSVFVPGHHLASGLARGAHGSYSNIAAMTPRGAVAWYASMHRDPDAAVDVERRLGVFLQTHVAPLQAKGLSNPALDKFLAAVGGWGDVGTRVRWPFTAVAESAVGPAQRMARATLPELFDPSG